MRPKLLDLFCGAGGAAMGYYRAGFDIVGVDIKPQKHYPFPFIQGDALNPPVKLSEFDAIHASPPCQKFTQMSARWRGNGGKTDQHIDWLTPTRVMLAAQSKPYVIENVVGARKQMIADLLLHGGMFGLGVHRPRLFELNFFILYSGARRTINPLGVYGERPDGRRLWTRLNGDFKTRSIIRAAKSVQEAQAVMGMDWGDWLGVKEAIPPAYTEFIGKQLMQVLNEFRSDPGADPPGGASLGLPA